MTPIYGRIDPIRNEPQLAFAVSAIALVTVVVVAILPPASSEADTVSIAHGTLTLVCWLGSHLLLVGVLVAALRFLTVLGREGEQALSDSDILQPEDEDRIA